MKRYIEYLKYLIRHKYFVTKACFKVGLYYRGLMHDISKFRPSEFIPYAKFFYNSDGSKKQIRDKTGYYKPDDTGDINFDFAWLLHQKRNDHHWQWWILPKDDGTIKAFPMLIDALNEMICDWKGAGQAQGISTNDPLDYYKEVREWYKVNKSKMIFHPKTRDYIENTIEYYDN